MGKRLYRLPARSLIKLKWWTTKSPVGYASRTLNLLITAQYQSTQAASSQYSIRVDGSGMGKPSSRKSGRVADGFIICPREQCFG